MSECIIEYSIDVDDGIIPGEVREQIVRCRDCRHFAGREGLCMRLFNAMAVEPHGFCAWGLPRKVD